MRLLFPIIVGKSRVILGERTLIMGVLNVTPDSFSDGGRYFDTARAIQHGVELAQQGADWIDVGGESTRPGSEPVPAEEELRRVLPVIRGLRRKLPRLVISIDTTKAAVAEKALEAGADILNDISGLHFEPRLAEVAHRFRAPLILMHMRGTPATMQRAPFARDIWRSLREGLQTSIHRALAAGVKREQIIVDPGLGFGKSRRQNYQIVAGLARLRRLGYPILIGASRKSFVQAIVAGEGLDGAPAAKTGTVPPPSRRHRSRQDGGATLWPLVSTQSKGAKCPGDSTTGTALPSGDVAIVVTAILGGAHIVRMHDPAAILPAVRVADALLAAQAGSGEM